MHVIFLREHNRIAEVFYRDLKSSNPQTSERDLDEKIYQEVRRIIAAQIQVSRLSDLKYGSLSY